MESRVINIALCSFGMSGWVFHAPFISTNKNLNFYGVWERTKNLAQQKYPLVKIFRNFEDLLADDEIDVVVVNTPSVTHYEFAKQSLLAGKHVLVEKPFTASVDQANELIEIAQQQKKCLSVFHNRRYDSDFKTVKKIIGQGVLGEIKEATISYDRYTPLLSPKAHKEAATDGVGIVYDLGSHLIDSALQFFGNPTALFADIFKMRENSLVDDYFEIIFYYSTYRVRLKASFFAKAPQGFIIHGSKGSFIKSRSDIQETSLQALKNPLNNDWGIEPESEWGKLFTKNGVEIVQSEKGNYAQFYEAFYQAITNKQTLPVTAEEGLNVIKIIEAAYKSNKERRVISF